MNFLAVIPARGGSKEVSRKNVRLVRGKPLIAYTLETALAARDLFRRVIVSTDDDEIAAVSREYGVDVPFLRPHELADDHSPMSGVLEHALKFAERQDGVVFDFTCLLQPTAPLRTADDVKQCVKLAADGGCDSVISVKRVYSTHPVLMKRIENGKLLPFCVDEREGTRRQDYTPAAYMRNGAIYITRRDVLFEQHSLWGTVIRPYVMPDERSVGVDSELDLRLVELLLEERARRDGSKPSTQ